MRAEVVRDGVALPVGAEERAVDDFEAAELRVGTWADAADGAAGAFGGRQNGAGEAPADAVAVRTGGEEGLAREVFLLAPGVDEALGVHLEALALGVISEGHARVRADQAPRGFDMRVDVDCLVEVQPTIDAPVERVDDVVRVFGTEAAEDDATVAEEAVGVGLGEVQQFGAGADEAAASVVRGDAGRDE